MQADQFVHFRAQTAAGGLRRHGDGQDNPSGMHLAEGGDGHPRTGARGDAIIHKDDRASRNFQRRQAAAKSMLAALEFAGLARNHLLDFPGRNAGGIHNLFIENAHTPAGNGAEGKLVLPGNAELAQNKDIERDAEPRGHFSGDRHATAWNTEDEYVRAAGVFQELLRQLLTSFDPIFE